MPQAPHPAAPSTQPSTAPPGGAPSSLFVAAYPVVGATAAAVPIKTLPLLPPPAPPGGASSTPTVSADPALRVPASTASTASHSSPYPIGRTEHQQLCTKPPLSLRHHLC